jgi:hypothetical protein
MNIILSVLIVGVITWGFVFVFMPKGYLDWHRVMFASGWGMLTILLSFMLLVVYKILSLLTP